jgi:serine/threonine protein kinase
VCDDPHLPLGAGSQLGPCQLLGPIGSGAMGEVHRARDPRLGREVAIKVAASDHQANPEGLRRFEDEARAAAAQVCNGLCV